MAATLAGGHALSEDVLAQRLAFVRRANAMKDVLRSGYTGEGARESVAEHTWRVALMAVAFADLFDGIDMVELLTMILIHDLGEIREGDVPATQQTTDDGRAARERADFADLVASLPHALRDRLQAAFDDYREPASREAVLAKGFDKLETILTHTQGANPADFDYRFNLGYARSRTDADPVLASLRAMIDAATQRRAEGLPGWEEPI